MRESHRRVVLLAIATLCTVASLEAQDGYRIIVNQANPVSRLSKAQISKLFLEHTTWDDGQPVAAVDLAPTSPVRETFSRDVLGMPASAALVRWRSASTAGRADTPPAVASDREVLAYVRLKPGAIGYVSAAADVQGVKVVSIARGDAGPAVPQEPVEVGGAVPLPEKVTDVRPIYPRVAITAHVEGVVEIDVVIGVTGNVEQTRVVRPVPMLDDAAVDAVRRWKYRPTLINGVPVPVKARVRVTFAL
jgi:TonB family protein